MYKINNDLKQKLAALAPTRMVDKLILRMLKH